MHYEIRYTGSEIFRYLRGPYVYYSLYPPVTRRVHRFCIVCAYTVFFFSIEHLDLYTGHTFTEKTPKIKDEMQSFSVWATSCVSCVFAVLGALQNYLAVT